MRVGRAPIDRTVTYDRPVTRQAKLGEIPNDYHSYSRGGGGSYESCQNGACDSLGRSVWAQVPTYEPSGEVSMETVTEHIYAEPMSPLTTGAKWGVLGAAAGAAVGALAAVAGSFSVASGAAVGASVGAVAGAALGANHAMGDRVRLEWRETPVFEKDLRGYHHDVSTRYRRRCRRDWNGRRRCRREFDGYNHRFRADIEKTPVATYTAPVVVHYREE